jgi:CO/xanthine dehydrogenase Mo-binding subunit
VRRVWEQRIAQPDPDRLPHGHGAVAVGEQDGVAEAEVSAETDGHDPAVAVGVQAVVGIRNQTIEVSLEMVQSTPAWFGPLVLFIWFLVGFWAVHKFRKIRARYLEEVSRVVGYQVESLERPFLGKSNIYTEGSEARRLQKEYRRTLNRLAIVVVGVWVAMVSSGWLGVTLANLLLG